MSDEEPVSGGATSSNRMQRMGRLFAILALGVVVLLIAATIIGISRTPYGQYSSRPASLPTPTFPSGTLPAYKATNIARINATFSATWTTEADAPTATFTTGIFPALQDKFATFYGFNAYKGEINGRWEIVRPGTEWPTPVTDYTSPGGHGAVQVYDAISSQLIGDFPAPDHSTSLVITSVKGDVLRLKSDKTASFGFDMATDTFTS
jgi:hypothetical protein